MRNTKKILLIVLALIALTLAMSISVFADGTENTNVAKIGDTEYATFEDAVNAIPTDGTDVVIKILTDIELTNSIYFSYGTGKITFTADAPVVIKQTKVGLDLSFKIGEATTIVVDENVTFEIYDNASGMYVYYGPSLEINGSISGGQNWGCLYLFNGTHLVSTTGSINVGRLQIAHTELTVLGAIDTNYLLVEGADFIANGAIIEVGAIHDSNNGSTRWGASDFSFLKGTVVNANTITLKYADSVINLDLSSSITANKIEGIGKIVIDVSGFNGTATQVIKADMSGFAGTVELVNGNGKQLYKITDSGLTIVSAVAVIGETYYATLAEAIAAAKAGDVVKVFAGTYAMPSMKAGITIVGEGEVLFEGTLSDTLENLTLKNIHIKGENTQRWGFAKGDLVFENVTFEATSVYALHFYGSTADATLLYKDCTIIGWVAMAGSPESCVFDGCTIKGNGTYGLIRAYFDATIKNCTFDVSNVNTNDDYEDGIHAVEGAVVTVTKCTNVNGNMKDIVNVHASSVVVVDGTEIKNYAKIGDNYYATLAEALAAANNGDTITLLANIDLGTTCVTVKGKELTINLNGYNITGSGYRVLFVDLKADENKNGKLTLTGNGTVENTGTNTRNSYAVYVGGNSELIVSTGVTVKSAKGYAVVMLPMGAGRVSTLTVNGGTVTGRYAVSGEGTLTDTSTVVTVNGGAIIGTDVAIYQPQPGTVTVKGGTVTCNGDAAIAMRRGTLTINGGVINGVIDVYGDYSPVTATINGGDFTNATLKYGDGNTVTKAASVELAAPEGYKWNDEGVLVACVYVAQVGDVKYESVLEALKAAIDNGAPELKLLSDAREKMTSDFDIKISADLTITADAQVKVEFYNEGTKYDFAIGSTNNNTLTIGENVSFDLVDRVIWIGFWGNNVDVVVNGYLGGYQIWHGADTTVTSTGTLDSHGEAFIMRRNATLTVDGGKVNANYFTIYSGHINAKNAEITSGLVWIRNNHNYGAEGTVSLTLDNTTFTSKGVVEIIAGEGKNVSVTLTGGSTITAKGAYTEGENVITIADEGSDFAAKNVSVFVASAKGIKYTSLAAAWAAAQDGDTIKLLGNIATSESITNTKKITLDLNGKTITGTDNATASFGLITNKGELTIKGNGKITLVATNDRDWNAYSSVISNTVGGKLIVENGTIEHLGGTDMAYGIDNLTNGKGTYAEVEINGGTIKSTYRAIRQFLNGVEAQNILTINGGTIEGTNKSIWMQDPSKNNNTGKLTVTKNATLNGDVYLSVTAGSTEWPVEVSIAATAVNGEVLLNGNEPAGYILEKKSGNWTINEYVAKVGNKYYKSLQAAVDAASQYQSVVLLQDCEGEGVVINKKTTIDFAGFTYSLTTPVGSTGTESNGFQILAGNYTVRLLNGTLKVADGAADKFYILVQNYSDLIVQKMTLDGTNLDKYAFIDGDSYTLSNNSGNVQINGSTIIANNDGDKAFAFDACDKSASGYELPTVVVYPTSKIVDSEGKAAKIEAAAKIGTDYYATLKQAIDAAAEGKTITLLAPIVVEAGKTLELNKKVTITYTSSVAGEDMITVRGKLIVDGATLVYKNTDTTASNVTVSTISCEPGSVLEVKNGVVKNNSANNGSRGIYAYAIDMLTNGNLGDVTATISGGEVISTNYMAIRQFNNGDACKNTLTVTGGYIYGAKRAIQVHLKNNAAYLAISGGTIEAGDYSLCLFPTNATNIAVTGGTFVGAVYSGTNGFITGGTFDASVYEGYITESYKQVKTDNGYEVIFDEAYGSIATIGDKKYSSLAAAWAAAQNGDKIVLQNNITIDSETFTVADRTKITLDLNGYTITVTDNKTGNYELFYIYGEMVITGKGEITLEATNDRDWNASSSIFHNRGGVLTIENGTYTHNGGTDMAYVVDNSGNWYGDATTNINDGTLTSSYIAIRNRMEQNTHGASGKAIINVYGGTINGTSRAIWAQAASTSTVAPATGEINIYGGTIGLIDTARSNGAVSMTTITGGTVAAFKGESGELKVNGGKITGTITILFADGTEPVKTVVKSKVYYGAVAKMGSTYFASLADALKKCTGAQAITLLRDLEGEGFVITGKTAIDFAGFTYTVTAPVAGTKVGVQINASGKTVRLINGTLKAADGSGVEVLVENNSTLTVQKQTLAVTSGTALVVKGGSVSINLATIDAANAVAFEVQAGKITVYSEGKSSFINGEKLAKKSGTNYVAK